MATVHCRTVVKRGADLPPKETRRPGIRERVFLSRDECPHQNIAVIDVDAGAEVELHPSPTSESFYVLEGEVEMLFPDGAQTLSPGDFCHLPTGVVHGLRSRQGSAKILLAFAPPIGSKS
jgi:quercetin dioxygenase-like cupin family protein